MLKILALILSFIVLAVNAAEAQITTGRDHITFEKISTITGSAGDTIHVPITARIHKYWHTYGFTPALGPDGFGPEPTTVSVSPKSVLRLAGKPKILKGARTAFDSVWEANVEVWSGTIELDVPVAIVGTSKKGEYIGSIVFAMQMCDTTACLPPDDVVLKVTVVVTSEGSSAAVDAEISAATAQNDGAKSVGARHAEIKSSVPATPQDEVSREKSKGLLSFFLYAMGVGFVALLTPCVFPMIPITVSFFTKRRERKHIGGVTDSMLFGLGIISTFTAVGILVSLIFGGTAIQDWAANAWMNLAIGLLFIVLAFNLFGAYEIQLPVSILNKLNKKSQGGGIAAVWLMGLTFSLTSFTCTVPFVGTLLLSASAASTASDFLYPAVGTLGFATAFALPFVVISMFPALLTRLPRAGGWMNNMKVVMGFIEIAAAVKFLSAADLVEAWGIMPREVFLSIWAAVSLLIVLYILGVFEMKLDSKVEKVGALRASFAVVFASLAVWFAAGILGKDLSAFVEALLPPDNYQELMDKAHGLSASAPSILKAQTVSYKDADNGKLQWIENLDQAKEIAKTSGKPIFIDFSGFSCSNCRLMEKSVFIKPVVRERFKQFVLVQLYTDRKTEPYISNQNILRSYGTVANPLYVLLRSDGSFIAQTGYLSMFHTDPNTFAAFLDKAL